MFENDPGESVIQRVNKRWQNNKKIIRFMGLLRKSFMGSLDEHISGRYNHVVFRGQPISMTCSHHNSRQRDLVRRRTEDAEEAVQPKFSLNLYQG